jgi:hypothetical protein
MLITSNPQNPIANRPLPSSQNQNPEPPRDDDPHNPIDKETFTWGQLGKGVIGSLIGGAIEGTGATLASCVKVPRIAFEAVRGTWKSQMLGPVLKATLTPVILAAGLATPVLAALAGTGYGMYEGFVAGAERNPLAAVGKSIDTCKQMHGKFTKQVVEGIRELAAKEPNSPEEVYEIKVVDGAKGLVASVASAAIDGVGIGGTALLHLPQAYGKVTKEIWKSDAALPLKVGGQFLATAGAVLAVPLGVVGGALYGLGKGAFNGYQHGLVEATKMAGQDVAKVHEQLNEFVED